MKNIKKTQKAFLTIAMAIIMLLLSTCMIPSLNKHNVKAQTPEGGYQELYYYSDNENSESYMNGIIQTASQEYGVTFNDYDF